MAEKEIESVTFETSFQVHFLQVAQEGGEYIVWKGNY